MDLGGFIDKIENVSDSQDVPVDLYGRFVEIEDVVIEGNQVVIKIVDDRDK